MSDPVDAQRDGLTLVVSLEALLLRSSLGHEAFWALLARDWRGVFAAWRAEGPTSAALIARAELQPEALCYAPEVLAQVQAAQEAGRLTVLHAPDRALAERVAAHLGLFAQVSVAASAEALAKECGGDLGQGFAYLGAKKAFLAAAAEPLPPQTAPMRGRDLLRALRPHQWLKNVLVFLPLLAAHRFDLMTLAIGIVAFYTFSLIASSVYVLNDLLDLGPDRAHPRKRNRPLAAGAIPIRLGTWLAGGLFVLGMGMAAAIGRDFVLAMAVYYALTLDYSLSLKRKIIIDIFALAGLYTMRIIAGGVATQVALSVWLLAFSMFFFLALAAVKRQAELIDSAARGKLKTTGRAYHVDDLPVIANIGLAAGYVSVLVLALYVNSPEMLKLYQSPAPLWGVCAVVLYWVTRVVMITHRGEMHDDPVVYAVKDRTSQMCFLIILALILAGSAL